MPDDPFDLLSLPARFDLSQDEIEAAWLARIARAHPDAGGAGGEDGGDSASRINKAKAQLEDAETRANLLLARMGGPTAEQDTALPDGFLMEIFAVREEMEQKLASGGDAARAELQEWANAQRSELEQEVGALFDKGDDPEHRAAIRGKLNVWRYIERMIEQLDPSYDPNIADFR